MDHVPDIRSLAAVPLPAPRGVYSYIEQPSGDTVYYAVTANGQLLNGELRRRLPDETEDIILREMWRDLDRQDATTTRPRLGLWVDGRRRR